MRSLTPDRPDTLTRTPAARTVPPFDWDGVAGRVADATERGEALALVVRAADHLGVARPDPATPLVVLQRTYGRLHRAAVAAA